MSMLRKLMNRYFQHFVYFVKHLGYRIFIALTLSIVVGLLDGFGLAMFFPLLEMIGNEGAPKGEGMGGLAFILDGFQLLRVPLNIYTILTTIAFFFILKGVFKFVEQFYNVVTQQYFIKKLRYDSLEQLTNLKYEQFVSSDVGRIQNSLTGEIGRVSQAYRSYFMAVQSGILVSVYILLAVLTDPQFAVLVVMGGGMSNFIYSRIYKKTKETSQVITKGGHVFQGLLIQKVAFFKYLKATGTIRRFARQLHAAIDLIESNTRKIGLFNSILAATREPVVVIVVILVIFVQVTFFGRNIGAILLSLMFFYRSLTALVQMQNYWNNFLNMSGSLSNITDFMDEMAKYQEATGGIAFDSFTKEIKLTEIHFSYGNQPFIQGLDLTIRKNETIAFVGESGSGKTTLVNMIVGLIPPVSGKIEIDGKKMADMDRSSFQSRIGYVTQEPVIFNDSIFNNVTFWDDPTERNRSRFWNALKWAAIDDFVKQQEQQENTVLGNNGIVISGGQKQRLSIARELYKDIDILVMDEATSALDSQTELAIKQQLDSLKGKYTIIIIAHRFSTIKNADRIVLMKQGAIEAEAPFESLMVQSNAFKEMVRLQELSAYQ